MNTWCTCTCTELYACTHRSRSCGVILGELRVRVRHILEVFSYSFHLLLHLRQFVRALRGVCRSCAEDAVRPYGDLVDCRNLSIEFLKKFIRLVINPHGSGIRTGLEVQLMLIGIVAAARKVIEMVGHIAMCAC